MNPTKVVFQSPDHSSTYANGDPKVTDYAVIAVPTNDPNQPNQTPAASATFPKASATVEGADYSLPIASILAQLPPDYAGYIFVKAQDAAGVGTFGTGQPFLKKTAPAPANVVAVV